MTFPDTDQGQRDSAYSSHAFGNGGSFVVNTHPPSPQEQEALAEKTKAERNRIQAEANTINDGRAWSKLIVRFLYGLYSIGVLLVGGAIGFGIGFMVAKAS